MAVLRLVRQWAIPGAMCGCGVAATSAYVDASYQEFEELTVDAEVERRLPNTEQAQRTSVVRLPCLLDAHEIAQVHALQAEAGSLMGSAGRTSANQAAAYRAGAWETKYLSTDGIFGERVPQLRAKLIRAVLDVDAERFSLCAGANHTVLPRCVEYHQVEPGGSLPYPHHHDSGSVLTIDVMLSSTQEFEGGTFQTLEADGKLHPHKFEQGDALVFVSHKPHCVSPVTAGRRNVLVMEMW
eukprot:CAMPEP_0183340204 /NCGR_PEP_ID=MMETSP0164_2-20130417/6838_1 /TAXON_ID=221442 /ORGANISM="Coccolithus pelagicus ssp braarudi, Strain PLY182g" /LENGTH=239 /DNA_ID=CAMNT_0025510305 /DNA_START=137 /DNA_END=853 /DNA_ORIENTATION=-